MSIRKRFVVLLCFGMLVASTATHAQTSPATEPNAAAASTKDAASSRLKELRDAGFAALYNLDYETARKNFNEIARLYPDHPAGPQFLAATLWAETLNESRRLQASLYNSESFFKAAEDKPNPKTVEQFRALTRQAAQLARARLRQNKQDVEALYFLGATEGLKAAFATAVERRFIAALGDGSSSVDRHRDVIKLDPNFHDAELTIGLYDYIVGGLPMMVKVVASVTGARGSKKRGLQTLERVAKEGRWARDDAKALLIVLYKREKRYAEALAFSRELSERYPRNYLFKLEAADALVTQAAMEREANHAAAASGAEREAIAIFDGLLKDRTTRDTAARSMDLIHYRYGEALFVAGQSDQAATQFVAAATVARAEPNLATMARLHAGRAYDLAGKRNEALAQYRIVLVRPDIYGSHEDAKNGMREPFKMKSK